MKKLLIIPMLFVCYVSYGQTLDSASIIGKSIKIGNLEVAQHDFPTSMNWDDAKAACAALGNGWRLPTLDELNILYQNNNEIGNFEIFNIKLYWSSTELDNYSAWSQDLKNGGRSFSLKHFNIYVRAIRGGSIPIPNYVPPIIGLAEADSDSMIGKSINIGNLLVAQHDFPTSMNWDDAVDACAALGPGWRLPTKDEWKIIY